MGFVTSEWILDFFSQIDDGDILKRRESTTVEFKQNLNLTDSKEKSKIAKTAAAFANNRGGVIIFGIKNKPHEIVGIENIADIDEVYFSQLFGSYLAPQINFSISSHMVIKEKTIVCLEVFETKNKPVVSLKEFSNLTEGDIYYRYSGQSTKIKPNDLFEMISEIKKEIEGKWQSKLAFMANQAIENIGMFRMDDGQFYSGGQGIIIDNSLLNEIKFLNEYSSENEGAPAVKIIGSVDKSAILIEKPVAIYENDILFSFLTNEVKFSPVDYIKQICEQSSPVYPIYFYMRKLSDDKNQAVDVIKNIKIRGKNKEYILNRIEMDKVWSKKKYSLENGKLAAIRADYYRKITKGIRVDIKTEREAQIFMESLFSIKSHVDFLNIKYTLKQIFDLFFSKLNSIDTLLRYSTSYIDFLENGYQY